MQLLLRITSFFAILLLITASVEAQTSASATSGFDLGAPPSQPPIFVDWNLSMESWMLQVDLIFDPSAGPMQKHFETPKDVSGGPILLDALQPFPQTLWEDFLLLPPLPGGPLVEVSDWHEEIHTPGWEWVIPGDPNFAGLFAPNESLVTMNGAPWPWSPIPMGTPDPTNLWVEFPSIPFGNVLDVHKALLWVGIPGNQIWGDNMDDAGNFVDESFIDVWEYPTPEPTTLALLCLGTLALLRKR